MVDLAEQDRIFNAMRAVLSKIKYGAQPTPSGQFIDANGRRYYLDNEEDMRELEAFATVVK